MLVHLCVPSEVSRLENALARGADALWFEGNAAAAAGALRAAREHPASRPKLYVRLDGHGETIEDDLNELMPAAPDGIVLPVRNGADVEHLGVKLAVREAELGLEDGMTEIIGLVTAPAAIFQLATFATSSQRLAALGFDTQACAAALGVNDLDSSPLNLARNLTLLAAKAAGIPALLIIEETESLAAASLAAKRDGFDGIVMR
ncbi:MAG: aldolase/citrate lyase family protein [Pseudomonadota bacterium]